MKEQLQQQWQDFLNWFEAWYHGYDGRKATREWHTSQAVFFALVFILLFAIVYGVLQFSQLLWQFLSG